jgi:hypothetical protein
VSPRFFREPSTESWHGWGARLDSTSRRPVHPPCCSSLAWQSLPCGPSCCGSRYPGAEPWTESVASSSAPEIGRVYSATNFKIRDKRIRPLRQPSLRSMDPLPAPNSNGRDRRNSQTKTSQSEQIQKHTTGGIPRWSPTLVLVARFSAYVWQSGRDAQFSLTYGRMYRFSQNRVLC